MLKKSSGIDASLAAAVAAAAERVDAVCSFARAWNMARRDVAREERVRERRQHHKEGRSKLEGRLPVIECQSEDMYYV